MNEYDKLIDSKIGWIGQIPRKWEKTILGRHIQIINGYPFSSDKFDLENGFPVVRIRDLVKGKVSSFYNEEIKSPVYVNNEDILVGMDGDFNAIWWQGGKALLNQRIALIKPKDSIDKKFLYYFLHEPLKFIHEKTLFTTIKHLSNSDLERIRCYLPKKNIQIKIRKYLDKKINQIDKEIEKNFELVKLLQTKENVLVNQAIICGIDSSNKLEYSGFEWIGDVPQSWQELRFFNILNEKEVRNIDGFDRKMLSVSQYLGIVEKEYESDELIKSTEETSRYKIVEKNDLVVNVMWLQFRGLAVSFLNGIVSPDYKVFNINLETINPYFLNYLVRSDVYLNEYPKHLRGIRPNSSRIINYDFLRLPLRLPKTLDEQETIVIFLDEQINKIKKIIRKTKLQIENLKAARRSIMYEATTGKINVMLK